MLWERLTQGEVNHFDHLKNHAVEIFRNTNFNNLPTLIRRDKLSPLLRNRSRYLKDTSFLNSKFLSAIKRVSSLNITIHNSMRDSYDLDNIAIKGKKRYKKRHLSLINNLLLQDYHPDLGIYLNLFHVHNLLQSRYSDNYVNFSDNHNVIISGYSDRVSHSALPYSSQLMAIPFAVQSAVNSLYLDNIVETNFYNLCISISSLNFLLFNIFHPFIDGNGRTSRDLLLISLSYFDTLPPLFFSYPSGLEDSRDKYLDLIYNANHYFSEEIRGGLIKNYLVGIDYNRWNLEGALEYLIGHFYLKAHPSLLEWVNYTVERINKHYIITNSHNNGPGGI